MRRTSWTSATILGSPKCVWRLLTYAANDLPRKCMNRRGMCRTFHLVMTHQIEHQSQDGKKASHCQKSNMRKSYMSISSKFVLASCHTLDNWRFFFAVVKRWSALLSDVDYDANTSLFAGWCNSAEYDTSDQPPQTMCAQIHALSKQNVLKDARKNYYIFTKFSIY